MPTFDPASPLQLFLHTDPNHGWLKVPVALLQQLGIARQITKYSYVSHEDAYLEEDLDATRFLSAAKAADYTVQITETHTNGDSFVRNLPSYPADPGFDPVAPAPTAPPQGWVMQILDDPRNGRLQPGATFLKAYDPEANDGRGEIELTTDRAQARQFASAHDLLECWRAVPANHPIRESDGRPNRPLSAYSVTPLPPGREPQRMA